MSFFGKKKKISQYKEADADGMWTWNVEYKKNNKGIDVDFEVIGTKPYIPKQPDPEDPFKMIEGSCDRLYNGLLQKRNRRLTDFDRTRLQACKVNRDNHFVREQAKKKKEEEDKRIKAYKKCLKNLGHPKNTDAVTICRRQASAKKGVKNASIIAKATSDKIGKFGSWAVKKATKSNEKSRYKNFGGKRKTRKRRKSRKKHTKKYGKRSGKKSQRRRRKRKTRKH